MEQFRKLLEANGIGWCFWPYKKMFKPSCVVSIQKPGHWDEITALAASAPGTGSAEKRIAQRPSIEICRTALNDLLEKIKLERCTVNQGYLKALGMNLP